MDPDFTALASRVAARAEVLGCVILSRDGLVLGAFPPHGEQDITPGLLRFASLGDPDRGFAQFSDELWAYVREGSYAAFAVAESSTVTTRGNTEVGTVKDKLRAWCCKALRPR